MQQPKTILVFDSGAGGLTVAREILQLELNIRLHYLADNAFFPYGGKTDQTLAHRIIHVIDDAIDRISPAIIVIACNTASTLALAALRERFADIDFIGVVPAIKPAAAISKTGHIGILATPATISREYTKNLIADFAPQHSVHLHGSEVLVEVAEALLAGEYHHQAILEEELTKLSDQSTPHAMDTVVLACTHFPLLKQQLQQCASKLQLNIRFIDSGAAIAGRVLHLLSAAQMKINEKDQQNNKSLVKVELTDPINQSDIINAYLEYLSESLP